MKRFTYVFSTLMIVSLLFIAASCDDDSPTSSKSSGAVKLIQSTSGGSLKVDNGTEIVVPAGAIMGESSANGEMTFSIETNVTDLPEPIPQGYTVIGGVTSFGPNNFIFAEPVRVWLNASSLESLDDICVIKYSESQLKWLVYPISDLDPEKKRIGISTLELGLFAVVRVQATANKMPQVSAPQKAGGIKYEHTITGNYYFTLTVLSFTPKYQSDAGAIAVGWSSSTGSQVTGGPRSVTYMSGIPQGNYQIIVSRVKAGTLSSPPGEREYYSLPATANVGPYTSTMGWDWYSWGGWSTLNLPGGGTWTTTRPSVWESPTKAYGTGDFHITLSWVNTSSSATDLDLHLYGPRDLHVYWAADKNEDGSIELDRDWLRETGNATENLYSVTSSIPRGEYKVYVDAYSGDVPKNFEVRIIKRGSSVKTYRGTATKTTYYSGQQDMIFIDKFSF